MKFDAITDLPQPVRLVLPKDAQAVFLEAAQARLAEDKGASPNDAIKAGWVAVERRWKKPSDGTRKWQNTRKWLKKSKAEMEGGDMAKSGPVRVIVIKADEEQRMVYGWASVISYKGERVIDSQDDIIEADELEKATTEFMRDLRTAKAMHQGSGIGLVLHSFPMVKGIMEPLGLSSDQEGWLTGIYVENDAIWERVKSGELRTLSIGGEGVREPATEAA